MKFKWFYVFLASLLLITNITLYPVTSSVNQREVSLLIYYIDGSSLIDDIKGRYLISYGVFPVSMFNRDVLNKLSDWTFRYPYPSNEPIPFNGKLDDGRSLSLEIKTLLNITDEYISVFVSHDVIFIYTHSPDRVLTRISEISDLIVEKYFDFLKSYVDMYLNKAFKLSLNDLDIINGFGRSVKIIVIDTPLPGYDITPEMAERVSEKWNKGPEYIGGYAYESTFGHYLFLIYLSCKSEVFNYSYTIDDILSEIDGFFIEIFGEDIPPIILEVMDECISAIPEPSNGQEIEFTGGNIEEITEKPLFIKPNLIHEISVTLVLDDDAPETIVDSEGTYLDSLVMPLLIVASLSIAVVLIIWRSIR